MKKNLTLKDIARVTGVHVSTVSRALDVNSRSTLTDEVVKRVRRAAEELGYRPNRLASGLRTNRTMAIGVMIPDITNTIFPPIVRGVESVLGPLGFASIIVNTDSLPDREAQLVKVLREHGVDGIIHAAATRIDPVIAGVAAQGLPIVTVNRMIESSGIPHVVNDDADGIRQVLHYLHGLGHRWIVHVAGPQPYSTGEIRLTAFREGCRDLGLVTPPEAIAYAELFDEAEGRRCTLELLDSSPGLTAIVCANDRLALGALEALRHRGIDCPRDVSVTGFNDIPYLDLIPPGLTTIRIQQFEAGQRSAEMLAQMIRTPEKPVPLTSVLGVELIRRGSATSPCAR